VHQIITLPEGNGQIIVAIIIRANYSNEGIHFFTPNDFSLQLAYMKRPDGHIISPHIHKINARKVDMTQEVLFIKSGKVKVDIYKHDKTLFESHVLNAGDVILLARGGHGIEILEESEIIEVKQGPYIDTEIDKEKFNPIN
jgi:hypothetical protein